MEQKENLAHCPICESVNISVGITITDYSVSKENFETSICQNCDFLFTNPRPIESLVGKYYAAEHYISHSDTKKGMVNRLYHIARSFTLNYKAGIAEKYSKKKSILDYGCGTGYFLSEMKTRGWEIQGIEPDDATRILAEKNTNSNIEAEENLTNIKQVSAITLWHVLEHVYPLKQRIRDFHSLLAENGTLIIAVPNRESNDATHYGKYWAAYDVPRHIYHFKRKNIVQLIEFEGFKLDKILPQRLDVFYISILSEKYKGNALSFVVGMTKGLIFFIKSLFNKEYSSLIYVFRKI